MQSGNIQFNCLAAEFIYLATSAECAGQINLSSAVEGIDFIKNEITILFAFLCIFHDFLNFSGCFFLFKAYQTVPPFQNFPTGQPAKPGKYYQQKTQNFN